MTETAIPWVLVPRRQSQSQFDAISDSGIMWKHTNSAEVYERHMAAVPPIPRDVFEQMVERGARVIIEHDCDDGFECTAQLDRCRCRNMARAALRAALGQKVEGDE